MSWSSHTESTLRGSSTTSLQSISCTMARTKGLGPGPSPYCISSESLSDTPSYPSPWQWEVPLRGLFGTSEEDGWDIRQVFPYRKTIWTIPFLGLLFVGRCFYGPDQDIESPTLSVTSVVDGDWSMDDTRSTTRPMVLISSLVCLPRMGVSVGLSIPNTGGPCLSDSLETFVCVDRWFRPKWWVIGTLDPW